ncbi:DotU family type IV/VI secretion system protein (plasmid) [Morganella morganii]|uniref:DotU family type IV/VI secretion system protein n=1 Tax=Morganella morganii TaxID=582 RepID=UPI0028D2813F|nr:DotU family type IV/VI secretion system protein [Morganella morganii]WNP32583.1 DotU family type IV/VI secretion system protein [Morganella morganii]
MSSGIFSDNADIIFSDTWLMACQLQEGVPVSDSEIFYRRACRLIDDTCVRLIEQDYSLAAVDLMQYAQCILIDESVINRPRQDTDHLSSRYRSLRIRYFGVQDAEGKLRDLLQDGADDETLSRRDVLLCYYRMLILSGMTGNCRNLYAAVLQHTGGQYDDRLPGLSVQVLPTAAPGQHVSRFRRCQTGLVTAAQWFGFPARSGALIPWCFTGALPPADYPGTVVLVCGQLSSLFPDGLRYREVAQCWYIAVSGPEELPGLIRALEEYLPSSLSQLSVLFAVQPERITRPDLLTQTVFRWRRALDETRQKSVRHFPFRITVYLSLQTSPAPENKNTGWFTLTSNQSELQAEQNGAEAGLSPLRQSSHISDTGEQLKTMLWNNAALSWLRYLFIPALTAPGKEVPQLIPSAWLIHWSSVDGRPGNIWQQFIQDKTSLPPVGTVSPAGMLPLPDPCMVARQVP